MFKKLFAKSKLHDCDKEQRFHVNRNRAVVHFGVIWQCPDCNAFWYRHIEYMNGISIILLRDVSTWRRLTKSQVKRLHRLVDQGYGQLEIAKRMNFERPSYQGDSFPRYWKQDIERYNQKPHEWIFK